MSKDTEDKDDAADMLSVMRDRLTTAMAAYADSRTSQVDDLRFAAALPKTRSGKIMRRLLRDVAEGRNLGDTTTLLDPGVVDEIAAGRINN